MKINKESFLKVLNMVAPALSEKAMIEGTDRFIFTGNKIVTYNDRICIFVPFKFDWKCSLPAKELKGIISAIKEDEIDFDLEGENGFLNVLKERILERQHAVIVVAEGAGQKFFNPSLKIASLIFSIIAQKRRSVFCSSLI